MSMIERVARALEAKITGKEFISFEDAARAAIEAMREPSNSMVWAHEVPHYGPDEAREAWRAMIDAALKEGL